MQILVLRWRRLVPPVLLAALLWRPAAGAPIGDPPQFNPAKPRVPYVPPSGKRPPPPTPGGTGHLLAFKAVTTEGWRFDFGEANEHRRLIVYLCDTKARHVDAATRAAQRLHETRHEHNMTVVGVMVPPGYRPTHGTVHRPTLSRSGMAAAVEAHLKSAGATFPCIIDRDGSIAARYFAAARNQPDLLPAFFAFPAAAKATAGQALRAAAAEKATEPADELYRNVLRLYDIDTATDIQPLAGHHPAAPDVAFTDSAGRTRRLSDYRGQVVVFAFIMRKCDKCKAQLAFLQDQMLKAYGQGARTDKPWLEVIAVCTDISGYALTRYVAERRYRFPVAGDADWKLTGAFRFAGQTPDTYVIAPDGTVRYHHKSHAADLEPVLHMEIRTLLGLDTTPMFGTAKFSGDRSCRVCHAAQHTDWALTRHGCAWETLVRIGKETDPKCVRCHVVATDQLGGFISEKSTPHLTDVQCESCHGGNGCKALTGKPSKVEEALCRTCHDAVHSPRFDFARARPRVLHKRAEELAKLPRAGREAELKRLCSGAGRELFDPQTPYIGSEACGTCHPTEYADVARKPHARATAILAKAAPDHWSVPPYKRGVVGIGKAECLRCHVTGYGRPGGFPAEPPADAVAHPLAGAGCESCHGPGKAHADDPRKPKAIAKLGGTCNECNVLPICRQCHDDANSPRFEYRDALPKARHETGKAVEPKP